MGNFNKEILIFIVVILFFHWFLDFFLQTEWQARNKSKDIKALLSHVTVYSVGMTLIGAYWLQDIMKSLILFGSIFSMHFLTDYITSNITRFLSYKAKQTDYWHTFFEVIGFDQLLHFVQIFGMLYLLMN